MKTKDLYHMLFVFFRLIPDSIKIAFNSLINNKLRTFLSLSGICIGIFCIILVMTVIDSLERAIRDNLSTLGDDTVYIHKWPWSFGGEYPWWRYINRPVPTIRDYEELKKRSRYAEAVAFYCSTTGRVEHQSISVENVHIMIITHDYHKIRNVDIEKGRYFSQIESQSGQNVAIIGSDLAFSLFENVEFMDQNIKISGNRVNVIGILQKEGENMFDNSMDRSVILPVQYARNIYNINSESLNPQIMVKPRENISSDLMLDELLITMRTIRRLKPTEDDNFALNQASMISKGLDNIFNIINLAGIIIGGFAILVGGFGIANIMFVSVKERTKIIGIQKAIGAKSYLILIQFLTEAVTLCLIGGILGLVLIWFTTLIISSLSTMVFAMSLKIMLIGLLISVIIGIISGYAPARQAAKMDPVVAINQV